MTTDGVPRLETLIERLEAATADVRLAITEAHSVIKTLREVERDGRALIVDIELAAHVQTADRLNDAVTAGLAALQGSYQKALDYQMERVKKVFDESMNVCLYGNKQGRGVNVFDELSMALTAARNRARHVGD